MRRPLKGILRALEENGAELCEPKLDNPHDMMSRGEKAKCGMNDMHSMTPFVSLKNTFMCRHTHKESCGGGCFVGRKWERKRKLHVLLQLGCKLEKKCMYNLL